MTVIDVGCARYGGDYSVERLLEMFRPDMLIGFDPDKNVNEAMPRADTFKPSAGGFAVIDLRREAAWTYDGEIGFHFNGLVSSVSDDPDAPKVRCVDLARFIDGLPAGPVVLKIDAEGAEYDLLEHLIDRGTDVRLNRILVEWHSSPPHDSQAQGIRRRKIMEALTCPVEQWRW